MTNKEFLFFFFIVSSYKPQILYLGQGSSLWLCTNAFLTLLNAITQEQKGRLRDCTNCILKYFLRGSHRCNGQYNQNLLFPTFQSVREDKFSHKWWFVSIFGSVPKKVLHMTLMGMAAAQTKSTRDTNPNASCIVKLNFSMNMLKNMWWYNYKNNPSKTDYWIYIICNWLIFMY